MARDPDEKLLGIEFDDASDRRRREGERTAADEEDRVQLLQFDLGEEPFAIPVADVRTIAPVPAEMTRVPRSPDAIAGVVDLRGEITAVVDPCVHFPGVERSGNPRHERLLVLDRPTDGQSTALWVDGVDGVETVPESDVLESVDDRELSGDALEHPLVETLAVSERETGGSPVSTGQLATGESEIAADSIGESGDDPLGTPFELGPESTDPISDAAATRTIVVEVTPVVDVESLLLASGTARTGD